MMTTTHLQGIGRVNAKPASELAPGDVTVWNYGYAYTVVSVERVSPTFVVVKMVSKENGSEWARRTKADFLVGVTG